MNGPVSHPFDLKAALREAGIFDSDLSFDFDGEPATGLSADDAVTDEASLPLIK